MTIGSGFRGPLLSPPFPDTPKGLKDMEEEQEKKKGYAKLTNRTKYDGKKTPIPRFPPRAPLGIMRGFKITITTTIQIQISLFPSNVYCKYADDQTWNSNG